MPLPHPPGYQPPRHSQFDRRWVLLAAVVQAPLARVHPCFGTPSCALLTSGLPMVAGGALVVQRNLTINQIFGLFGGFTVLGFLLVGGTALAAVSAMAVAYLSGTVGQQNGVLITFAGLLLICVLRVWWVLPAAPDRLR
jgi:hypothetical protein